MAFFALAADPNQSSLQDNVLKSEINNIRNVISSTSYKTKLVVVLLGDDTIVPSILDERISNIRRFCTLDAKSLYFIPSASSRGEVAEFVQTLLVTLRAVSVEYYRDLSKHARRKRNRGSIPLPTIAPTAGTSQILTTQGWNARYEFKLGVFAEFRQEMDAACRNYESAYESLFSPELFDSIASRSPRFNEARMLADAIAIRIIRCQLWTEQPTGAVRSWRNHRDRIRSIVDRKGKGTENYGWEAWESIWSKTMAEMVARVDLSSLSMLDPQSQQISSIFALPEKALPIGERIAPWELLHHAGYWLVKAVKHTQHRRVLALQLPEEDRNPPGQSPASKIASKANLYDAYLAPEPFAERPLTEDGGYDYCSDVTGALKAAMESFAARGQLRTNERLELEEATELLEEEVWTDASLILTGLWKNTKWRSGGWFNFLSKIGWALFQCASQMRDQGLIIRLMWELSSRVFPAKLDFRYDLHTALASFESPDSRPAVMLSSDEVVSSVLPRFAFGKAEGNVGQPLQAQLSLIPQLQTGASPICFAEIKIVFEGGLRPVHLVHDEDISISGEPVQMVTIDLEDSSSLTASSKRRSSAGAIASLTGRTHLSVGPGDAKIYMFHIIPREAGDVKIASITMIVEDPQFSLTVVSSDLADAVGHWWEMKHNKPVSRSFGMERNATEVKILPKPPMVRIHAPDLKQAYYTNEIVRLPIEIINDEDDAVTLSAHARLISPRAHAASLKWADDEAAARPESESEIGVLVLPDRSAGNLAASSSSSFTLLMDNTLDALDHELEIVAKYYVASDPETPLVKVMTFDLPFIRPFEANYNFGARYDEEPWPDFFKAPGPDDAPATGLTQKYLVKASVYSFASGELEIDSTNLVVHRVVGGAICTASSGRRKAEHNDEPPSKPLATSKTIAPDETQDYCFDLMAQKIKLGDRHAVGLDSTLEITWRRPGSSESAVSTLEIPRFVAPMAEPRVLLTDPVPLPASNPSTGLTVYQLKFTLENPSMHFLTFNLIMESSEDFAFSGPKATSVSLVPLSRHTVEYRLLLSKTNTWIGVNLGVVDAYFGKQLRVLPAGDGVKSDKKGNVNVWMP
jgi:trafficking protein particle complex subunit 11